VIRHILLIQFKPIADPQKIKAVQTAFLAIPAKIEGVEAVEWGENDSPEGKNRGFTHCVLMTFADEAARKRYLPHPEHQALIAIFRPLLDEIIVLDYSL
jgi:uncharacterized protein (DUF1330 family)